MNSNEKWIEMENESWAAEKVRHDLLDITFVIPVRFDSPERMENLQCICKFLQDNFATNIHIIEDTGNQKPHLHLGPFSTMNYMAVAFRTDGIFHRTAIINFGICGVRTKYFAIWDTDVIVSVEAIIEAQRLLCAGADMVYPYSGKLIDIARSYVNDGIVKEKESYATNSYGGGVFLNTASYRKAGCDNENLISHCPDDIERWTRMKTLGYDIKRVPGTCWHIEHPIGINSRPLNAFTGANEKEYSKVGRMNRQELEEYIKTWRWAK